MDIKELIEKYDIDNGFKKSVSVMLSKIEPKEAIYVLADEMVDLIFSVSYNNGRGIDGGNNVKIDIRDELRILLLDMFGIEKGEHNA